MQRHLCVAATSVTLASGSEFGFGLHKYALGWGPTHGAEPAIWKGPFARQAWLDNLSSLTPVPPHSVDSDEVVPKSRPLSMIAIVRLSNFEPLPGELPYHVTINP